jgi:hypothetical protein
MKQFRMIGLLLICMMFASKSFAQSGSTEQLIVPLSSPGKPYTLKVELVTGSIKVISYEGKDILIDVTVNKSDDETDTSNETENGMKRISTSGSYEVTAKEADNTVKVNTSNPLKSFNLNFKIPQDVKLKLSTVNNGDIEVENVKGELEVTNVNGAIKLTNISGSVVANTVNGAVTTTFATVDPKAPMAFSTLNGNVTVTLPANSKANLKLKSDMGEIYSDFDIDIDKTKPNVNKTNEPGMYKIMKEDWVYGKINGGGPEMLMKNMFGNIYVKKAAK